MRRGREMVAEGADVVDVGGESTRPGAGAVAAEEELRRVVPVVEALAGEVRVSVDTTKASVAHAALCAGATLAERRLLEPRRCRCRARCRLCGHAPQGDPGRHAAGPSLRRRRQGGATSSSASALPRPVPLGVAELYIDPGIGFGKTVRHNLQLLAALPELVATGVPVLVGTSRKSFIGHLGAGGSCDGRVGDVAPLRTQTTVSKARSPRPCGRWPAGWLSSGSTMSRPPCRRPVFFRETAA